MVNHLNYHYFNFKNFEFTTATLIYNVIRENHFTAQISCLLRIAGEQWLIFQSLSFHRLKKNESVDRNRKICHYPCCDQPKWLSIVFLKRIINRTLYSSLFYTRNKHLFQCRISFIITHDFTGCEASTSQT